MTNFLFNFQALFALEDIIGGHAAVSNFVIKVLGFLAMNKEVQKNIQTEIDNLLNERSEKSVLIADRNKLIYTEAVIMETLRIVSSPIVPHVANQDSSIDGTFDLLRKPFMMFNGFLMDVLSSLNYRLFSESWHINFPQQLRFKYVTDSVGRTGKV